MRDMSPNEIALYYERDSLGSFSTKLMDLFGMADMLNKARLTEAFPEYAEGYLLWFHKPEGWDIIKENS